MITITEMRWNNFFSYGDNNVINFTRSPITQLVGLNGAGKTSIPLILEEILYGKNSKKTVKSKLKNRYLKGVASGEVKFIVDGVNYEVIYIRGSNVSLILQKEGEDISSHTVAGTLKLIEDILGLSFETFSQLIYQSSKSSLQFLTATDTQRKKFLISLFGLEKYINIHEKLKPVLSGLVKDLAKKSGELEVAEKWLEENSEIPEKLEVKEVPGELIIDELVSLEAELRNLTETNRRIEKNNAYKEQLESLDKDLLSELIDTEAKPELEKINSRISEIAGEVKSLSATIDKHRAKKSTCYACGQPIDISDSIKLAEELSRQKDELTRELSELKNRRAILQPKVIRNTQIANTKKEFEQLVNLIDSSLPETTTAPEDLQRKILEWRRAKEDNKKEITTALEFNESVKRHNASVDAKILQKEKLEKQVAELKQEVRTLAEKNSDVDILKKAFSTNGLVSYKLEFLTKDLENVINEYLSELSKGRFQVTFVLEKEKLNVRILDDGEEVSINELSEGELSKVNVSTLLAIRSLMQSLSNTELNILFLDEIMGVLDAYGKEDLIDILLKEPSLNTFLVSHEYTHPLVPVINVVKEDKISRLDYE